MRSHYPSAERSKQSLPNTYREISAQLVDDRPRVVPFHLQIGVTIASRRTKRVAVDAREERSARNCAVIPFFVVPELDGLLVCFLERFSATSADSALIVWFFSNLVS